jgi:hypothetical protein
MVPTLVSSETTVIMESILDCYFLLIAADDDDQKVLLFKTWIVVILEDLIRKGHETRQN